MNENDRRPCLERLVELMGGKIWVESEKGKGSTFHFTVRFGVQSETARQRIPRVPQKVKDIRVLVVDDNSANLCILRDTLLHWQMRPTAVNSGAAALYVLQHAAENNETIRLILLDARMPEMDGFTLAEQIKQRPEYGDVTIMMLASDNQRGDIARCRDLGVAAYLTKPIQQTELLRTIVEALGFSAEINGKAARATPGIAAQEGQPLRILLAEDNVVNQLVAVHMLMKQGHTVVVANNDNEALAALQKQSFDLMLMDVQMPEMGGFEATEIIRQDEMGAGRRLPIIAMTAHAMKGDRERCLEAGMDGYVSKPVQAKELREAIDDIQSVVEKAATDCRNRRPADNVLDGAALLARVDGDRLFLKELIELFIADCPEQMAAIQDAIARVDADGLQRTSHSLRGSVSNFFAPAAVEAALHLETRGRTGDLAGVEKEYGDLENAIYDFRRALDSLIDETEPSVVV